MKKRFSLILVLAMIMASMLIPGAQAASCDHSVTSRSMYQIAKGTVATCTEPGYNACYQCTNCQNLFEFKGSTAVQIASIADRSTWKDELGHNWNNKDGVCARSGCSISHDPHVWSNGVCGECGVTCSHNWNNGVCQNGCGATCDHDWNNGVCKNGCGATCDHDWTNGVCGVCGASCSHDWNKGVCDECGAACSHDWSNNDGVCAVCKYAPCAKHSFVVENGYTVCSVCKYKCTHSDQGAVLLVEKSINSMMVHADGSASFTKWTSCLCGRNSAQSGTLEAEKNVTPATCTDHEWITYTAISYSQITRTVFTSDAVLGHNWSNKDGKCARQGCNEVCQHPDVTSTSNNAGKHTIECNECGYGYAGELFDCADHSNDGKCDFCGYAFPVVKPIVKPTKPTYHPPVVIVTPKPTAEPTAEPTPEPTAEPTPEPTAEPTVESTKAPVVDDSEDDTDDEDVVPKTGDSAAMTYCIIALMGVAAFVLMLAVRSGKRC